MSSPSLAVATSLGVSPDTLARLERAGLDTEAQQRFTELAVYAGVPAHDLLPYVERGVTLQTLSAAIQVRGDSVTAELSHLDDLVTLADSVGEIGGERPLPAGLTILNGRLVTAQEAARAELENLDSLATEAGFDPTAGATEVGAALPGNPSASESAPEAHHSPEQRKELVTNAFRTHSDQAYTAQEQIINSLLETAEFVSVVQLNKFIANEFDGDALKAYGTLNRDEREFRRRLTEFVAPVNRDALFVSDDEEEATDDEEDTHEDDAITSIDELAEAERAQEEYEE